MFKYLIVCGGSHRPAPQDMKELEWSKTQSCCSAGCCGTEFTGYGSSPQRSPKQANNIPIFQVPEASERKDTVRVVKELLSRH